MTREELNKACEIVRDLANEHFGDWEQSCKFEDAFRKAMTEKTNPLFEKCLANVNPDIRAEVRRNMDLTNLTWKDMRKMHWMIRYHSNTKNPMSTMQHIVK